MKRIIIAGAVLLLASCVHPPVFDTPRAVPVRPSIQVLHGSIDKVQIQSTDIKKQVDQAYDKGLVAGSKEAITLRDSVSALETYVNQTEIDLATVSVTAEAMEKERDVFAKDSQTNAKAATEALKKQEDAEKAIIAVEEKRKFWRKVALWTGGTILLYILIKAAMLYLRYNPTSAAAMYLLKLKTLVPGI